MSTKTNEVKATREQMDNLMEVVDQVNSVERTRETASSYTSLQLSRMWYGKQLLHLGEPGYKKDGKRESAKDIEPPTDKGSGVKDYTKQIKENRTKTIDSLRTRLREVKRDINKQSATMSFPNRILEQTLVHLEESIMWLGAELGRIYENNNK